MKESTATTTARVATAGMTSAPGRLALGLILIGMLTCLIATIRLGAVVAATPTSLWFVEYPRLVDLSVPVSADVKARADWAARYLGDPDLIRGKTASCGPETTESDGGASCLAALDAALLGNPAAGELWLLKANTLFRANQLGDALTTALRRSYEASPKEGWIAAERVLAGLRLYPLMPPDIQASTLSDLNIVLSDATLARPLIDAYPRDLALRRAAAGALRALPEALLNKFVSMAKSSPH